MRYIILDTETTGLSPTLGHRIIEVAAVEMVNRRLTGNRYHCYLNPEREIDMGAQQVHGISTEFLQDKPKFAEESQAFLNFIAGGVLVIHNAPFDVGFLNHELARLNLEPVEVCCEGVIDTLKLAKELHPGQKNNLDALCRRYVIDNAHRTLHGALLDAELLAEVYLAMTRGQESLMIEMTPAAQSAKMLASLSPAKPLQVRRATAEELMLHASLLADIEVAGKSECVWNKLG